MKFPIRNWIATLLCTLSLGCAAPTEKTSHNDPSKYTLEPDVLWASPDGFDLTMDIYTPTSGKESYPVLMIFHGGGWLINDKSIMDQAAKYFATNSEYVICNVDYRLLGDQDNSVTIDQIVEDTFGAVLWTQHNIHRYQGDTARVALTGDSAGAHLAAMVVNRGQHLSSQGYTANTQSFTPSYLPLGETAESIAQNGGIEVQAALLSYGAFDLYQRGLSNFETWKNPFWLFGGALPRSLFAGEITASAHPELYKGVSPAHTIPMSTARALPPQLMTVGSADTLTTPALVKDYLTKLQSAGHPAEYWEYADKRHAYLDSGHNPLLGVSFADNAPHALDVMIAFLDGIFYPAEEL
ncbi:MAG: acetyl esterase [Candidatus Azotimanducaceae bacterium]|jgi:acetyl esterase|tara:strand:+ start:1357 stop:2415 length:1059 start_codon:yes stop_codon:yes gene_type:complete